MTVDGVGYSTLLALDRGAIGRGQVIGIATTATSLAIGLGDLFLVNVGGLYIVGCIACRY